MSPNKRTSILTTLTTALHQKGNWCGETHLQKAVFMLQTLAGVETDFDFVLYKHGPFSFDLRDELTSLRADGLLDLRIQPQPYGPKLIVTPRAAEIEQKFPKTLGQHRERINFVADVVGDNGVADLERLSTALFVTRRELPKASVDARAARLHEIKPHISIPSATEAIQQIDTLIVQATQKGWIN